MLLQSLTRTLALAVVFEDMVVRRRSHFHILFLEVKREEAAWGRHHGPPAEQGVRTSNALPRLSEWLVPQR